MRGAAGARLRLGLWLPWLGLACLGPGTGTGAFNLDAAEAALKDGPAGSLFGFSVALHRQLRPAPAGW